jgi:hypothetical protein
MIDLCPKVAKCPIFLNNVLIVHNAEVAYKKLYCEAGVVKYSACKRFIVSNKIGKCTPDVMPNCSRSVEEIIAKIMAA